MAAIGPLILLAILASIDVDELGKVLERASMSYWIVAYAAAIPAILLRAVRLRLAMGRDVGRPRFGEVLNVYSYSLFAGTATPGRLGEFIKVFHLTRWGAHPGSALATVLLERIPDIMFLLIVGALSLALFAFPGMEQTTMLLLVVGAPIAAIAAFWLLVLGPGTPAALRLVAAIAPAKLAQKVMTVRDGFVGAVAGLRQSALIGVFACSIAAWALNYFSNYLFALSLGLSLSYWQVAGLSAVCSLITLVPISIMGAGTRDAALIVMMAHYHASQAEAVALSTLFLSLILCNALLCSYSLATPAARFARRVDD